MGSPVKISTSLRLRRWYASPLLTLSLALAGCAPPSNSGSTTASGPFVSVAGNWSFALTPTSGAVPFPVLSGFLNEEGSSASGSNFVSAAMQQTSSCFGTSSDLSAQGGITGTGLGLVTFPVDGQTMTIGATRNSTGDVLTGSYSVSGGCADGAAGTLIGTLYQPLSGTYTSSGSGSLGGSLTLLQEPTASGDGKSYVGGSAMFTGVSCFSTGSIEGASAYVLGSSVSLTFTTNEAAGSTISFEGTFTPDAKTVSLTSSTITGGSCSGQSLANSLVFTKGT